MNQEDLGAARRSQRPRSGLSIFDETLLFELHAEMMQKEEVVKRPRSSASARPPRPPSAEDTPRSYGALGLAALAAAGADGGETSEDQRAAKRARSAGGTSADDDYDYADEDGSNARTAWACGINFEGLSEDEKYFKILPPEGNPQEYAKIRNYVLALWRKDVSKKMMLQDVLHSVKPKDRAYALAAWQFLNTMGYINFGVAPEIQHDVESTPDTRGSVIVVGAGCSGLSAARQLRSWGYRVIVVEGRNRPGGRVFSSRLSAPKSTEKDGTEENNSNNNNNNDTANFDIDIKEPAAVIADVGGSIITGIDGNPLAVLTKQLQIPLSHIRDNAPIFMPDGTPADDALDSAVEQYYNHVLMKGCNAVRAKPETVESMSLQGALEKLWAVKYSELESLLPEVKAGSEERKRVQVQNGVNLPPVPQQYPLIHPTARKARQMFEWHLANLEFANACKLDQCSLLHWDQDDPHELPGAHCFVPGCNGRWLQALCKGISVLYNHPVSEIRYCKSGVAVHTANKVLHADAVVVTAPLGVLKRGGIAFNPPLSEHKLGAISRLGFGNLNKVILMFPKVFWSENEDMFGHVAEDPASRGEAFLFYSYAHISGGAQLTALIAGSAAEEHEKRSASDSVARVMAILRSIFEPKGVTVPPPLQALITRWGSDPMSYGAYSSLPVGCQGGEDYDIMAKSVGGRVFFAGEATTRRYPATMHGAFFTGLWAAADVDAALSKSKSIPQFGNTLSMDVVQKVMRAEEEKATAAAANLANLASVAAAAKKPPRPTLLPGSNNNNGFNTINSNATANGHGNGVRHSPTPEEVAILDRLVQEKLVLSSRLKMLFDDPQHPPDLEVGSFKAVYGAPGSHVAHQALLRIDITSARGKFSKEEREGTRQVNLYCVVLKDTAMAVAEQVDNYARVALLGSLPSVKLVERTGLGPDALSIMDSVMRWRRKRETIKTATTRAVGGSAGGGAGENASGAGVATNFIPPAIAFNPYAPGFLQPNMPLPYQQFQQHFQQPVFAAGNGNGGGAAAAAAAFGGGFTNLNMHAAAAAAFPYPTAVPVAGTHTNGLNTYQQQQQQQQQQQVEVRAVAPPAPPAPPPPAPGPAPAAAEPAAQPAAPYRPQSAFSALDIALGLAVSSIDIIDLTTNDKT